MMFIAGKMIDFFSIRELYISTLNILSELIR